jgi:hypothetical protein
MIGRLKMTFFVARSVKIGFVACRLDPDDGDEEAVEEPDPGGGAEGERERDDHRMPARRLVGDDHLGEECDSANG